ncbi:MAG: glycoside hydrolase [Bacteroidales bacterium]|nr:glycoside hydrolase [Bacteroidales bacterium]
MKNLLTLLAVISSMLVSCCEVDPTPDPVDIEAQLSSMTLREKVGQLFIVRPESLAPSIKWTKYNDLVDYSLQEVNNEMKTVNEKYPVGGVVLFAHNIKDEEQLSRFIPQIRDLKGRPLLCVDEEGGRVARIANNGNFNVEKFESMAAIGASGEPTRAFYCGNTIGTYLKKYGFDIDFAPVADVNTNPDNVVIGARAFSDDPAVAAPMVTNYLQGLNNAGIIGCVKHFPGHGDVSADTHYGYAQSMKTWSEMLSCEMVTFKAGIDWGCRLIMTAHIAAPNVTGSEIPSTMSSIILQDKLRSELGYKNLIITDAMDMGAIMNQYTDEEAAVGSIKAGVDIIVCPKDFIKAFDAVVAAVEKGEISEDRINQSVRRVLQLKMK